MARPATVLAMLASVVAAALLVATHFDSARYFGDGQGAGSPDDWRALRDVAASGQPAGPAVTAAAPVCAPWATPQKGPRPPSGLTDALRAKPNAAQTPGILEDLSAAEINSVLQFLTAQKALALKPVDTAGVNENFVAIVELLPPTKFAAIKYLNNPAGVKPRRAALATIIIGQNPNPRVITVAVAPLPKPTKYTQVEVAAGKLDVPFHSRPWTPPDTRGARPIVEAAAKELTPLFLKAFGGYSLSGCKDKCLVYQSSGPYAASKTKRQAWYWFCRALPGFYEHPVGFEMLVDMSGNNVSNWRAVQFYFGGRVFASTAALLAAYNDPKTGLNLVKSRVPTDAEAIYSTYRPRPQTGTREPLRGTPGQPGKLARGPVQFEPDGRRFTIQRRHIEWMGWALEVGVRPSSGLRFWDIRFKGSRIVYELALQEAYAGYGGTSPVQSSSLYWDSAWSLGTVYRELMHGFDCPLNAAYMDLTSLNMYATPRTFKNAFCVFEQQSSVPLLRHYEDNEKNGYSSYGNLPGSSLIIRGIASVYNYDYLQDLVLHLDGSLEVQAHASGYIQAQHWVYPKPGTNSPLGAPVFYDVSGTLHDHLLNWKVDLDIVGTKNSMRVIDIMANTAKAFNPVDGYGKKTMRGHIVKDESESGIQFDYANPKVIEIVNEAKLNKYGIARGYRIQLTSVARQLLPKEDNATRGAEWSRYQIAVTKRKETEPSSSSIFEQAIPNEPVVQFGKFLADRDNLQGEDLVAWVTSGHFHVPTSEDMPSTPTIGTKMGFILRPASFFDESAAADIASIVWLNGYDQAGKPPVPTTALAAQPECVPTFADVPFDGRY